MKWCAALALMACLGRETPTDTRSEVRPDPPCWVVIYNHPEASPFARWIVIGSMDSGKTWTKSPVVRVDQFPAFAMSNSFWYRAAYVNDAGKRGRWSKIVKNERT